MLNSRNIEPDSRQRVQAALAAPPQFQPKQNQDPEKETDPIPRQVNITVQRQISRYLPITDDDVPVQRRVVSLVTHFLNDILERKTHIECGAMGELSGVLWASASWELAPQSYRQEESDFEYCEMPHDCVHEEQ